MAGIQRWWSGALLVLLATGATPAASERPLLVIHVDDRVGVAAEDLAAATRRVDEIFADAGVSVIWKEGRFPASVLGAPNRSDGASHVALMLVTNTDRPLADATGCVLGFAAKRPAVAYAYYNRILDQAQVRPIDTRVLLSRVIAHELGHVLLPPNSHSSHGIMRASIDLERQHSDRFVRDQARAIRGAVAALPY